MKSQIAIVTGILLSFNAAADEEWIFGVGAGVTSYESAYKGVGTETTVFPSLYAQKGNFLLAGNKVQYTLYGNSKFQVNLLGQYRFEGYEAGDSYMLNGMEERDGALEAGVSASFDTHYGILSASFVTDISDTHEGHELSVGWAKPYQLNAKWMVKPSLELNWRSDDLNNYYYGVKSNEATVQRAVYKADSSMSYRAGVDAFYVVDKQQTIQMGIGVNGWGSEIEDSPIVDRSNSPEVKAAYTFRF
ncbi:MipA/OmpV family protein [Neptuniibacter sp. PT8_73]|uniref:MipA/OmpV family protein n=1 Tax=Neptuniibacter sp. PT8_73 TaxID=3398206 RepID=UPI0039F60A8A